MILSISLIFIELASRLPNENIANLKRQRSSKPEVYYRLPSEVANSPFSPETSSVKRKYHVTSLVSLVNNEQLLRGIDLDLGPSQ